MENYSKIHDLSGQVALVIGGAGGLGREMCIILAQNGADIIIGDLNIDLTQDFAEEIRKMGRKCVLHKVNILDESSIKTLTGMIEKEFGRLDILVNSAGISIHRKAEEFDEASWDKVMDINLKGAYMVSKEVGKIMIKQKKGKIINISSVRSKLGMPEGYIAYCASKGGINMFTKCLASEWARHNITVNAIAPTFIRTSMNEKQLEDKVFYDQLVKRIPMNRIGVKSDLAGPLLFFASAASKFVTGQILYVDGGLTAIQ